MRQNIVSFFLLVFVLFLGGCLVSPHPYHHQRQGVRCQSTCLQWGYRQDCSNTCRAWRNGVCIDHRPDCRSIRYCMRHGSRCY